MNIIANYIRYYVAGGTLYALLAVDWVYAIACQLKYDKKYAEAKVREIVIKHSKLAVRINGIYVSDEEIEEVIKNKIVFD